MCEPLVAQFVESGAGDHQPLGGDVGVELAGNESSQDLLHEERRDTTSQLLLFMWRAA